jgi:hypothetical protein
MGEKLKAAVDAIPDVMAELTRDFVEKKDLNARVQVRLRMKALLDFLSADTEYPPNPIVDGKKGPAGFAADQQMQSPAYAAGGVVNGNSVFTGTGMNISAPIAISAPVPIPAAQPIDNTDILG